MPPTGSEQVTGKEGDAEQKAVAPQFVPAEEFKQLQALVSSQSQLLAEMSQGISAIRASGQAPAKAEEEVAEVTDAEIQEAMESGNPAALRKLVQGELSKFKRSEVDPLRTTGLTSLTKLVQHMARADMPHYDEFKKDIDGYIDRLPAELRLDPGVYKAAHDAVVGENVDKIVAAAVEKALRGENKPEGGGPGSTTGREKDSGKVPTVADLLGRDAADALADRGLSADQHAQKLGYKDWPAYAALTLKQQGGE